MSANETSPVLNGITQNGEGDGRLETQKKPPNKKLTVEKIYQKKSQLEHILLRPDTYIGSVEPVTEFMWIFDTESQRMVQKDITYVPGLYKIFDEILVNAADNKQRDPAMDCIKVEINSEANVISVWNNGKGVPVVEHKGEKMYVATMIFGHLLTSSNYNDEEEKVTGGRNGFGAKLCNIFSTKFTVETSCAEYKRCFKQTWADNMTKASDPKIKDSSDSDYTKVTFSPDLTKFKMEKLDNDIVSLMSRRVYDAAASTRGVKVYLNGKRLPVKNFQDYIQLYIKDKEDELGSPLKVVYESVNPRWEVALTLSDRGFQQVSFVNSIATTKGGRHVDYVCDAIVKQLIDVIKKKNKGGLQVKPFQIKNHMWLFVNCLIVNPTFDSQTKENMTLQAKSFGSKCSLSEKFINNVTKSGIVEAILTWAKVKAETQLQKSCSGKKQNKIKGIPKLEDANNAGTKNSLDCTLILTEGDSAKTLAVSGLGVVGRDKYGVFPLRGKLLNVREATHKQIVENAEINNIIKILGLQYKKKYETMDDLKTLRYGRLMIMTDQDQDGSHIKGLLINFIHTNWPSLLKLPFLEEFITPIIKATKGKEELSFYSLPEFEEWKREKENWHTYKIKYYKGLGTSTSKEAKEYFADMKRHRILFKYAGDDDDKHIQMAFSKKLVDARKEWLTNWMGECKRRAELGLAEDYLYTKTTQAVSYKDFINKELVLFSNMDNERSIPSLVDGLKPGSRKVLFTCLKRNDKREVKVAQLAGSVAEHSAYHHGEVSLMSTIINLAQNFVGSNNINLLQPIGQFGTRLQGGKDAASPRYIFTMLSPLTRLIFHPHDDPLLKYLRDDNQKIEPQWYIPIIPMVLVNGAEGIGTGWMTKIPNHNPREIVEILKRMLQGEEPVPMKPWYKNFRGEVEALAQGRFVVSGEVSIIDEETIEISELPVGTWTQQYKESVLEVMLHGANEKSPQMITDYKEYNTDTTVRFVVSMTREKLANAELQGLHKVFKLQSTFTITSMCAFDKDNCLKKYDNVTDIVKEFYSLRLMYYDKRKQYLQGILQAEARKLSNQARFIIEKCDGILTIENKKKKAMIEELVQRGYDSDPVKAWKIQQDREALLEETTPADQSPEEETDDADSKLDFDYLLGMSMWTLTKEKKDELLRKKDDKHTELRALEAKTPGDLWRDDLDTFLITLDQVEQQEREDEAASTSTGAKATKKMKLGAAPKKKKALGMSTETMPSPVGRRVQPKIDDEMKKKAEKAVLAKEKKGIRQKKKDDIDDKDEFDLLAEEGQKSLTDRIGTSPEMIEKKTKVKKEKKLNSKPRTKGESPKKKKKRFNSDDSFDGSFSSDDGGSPHITTPLPTRTVARRSAAQNVKFKFDSDEEDFSDDNNLEFKDNDAVINGDAKDVPVTDPNLGSDNDNDDDFVLGSSVSEDEKEKPKHKGAPKKKAAAETKKMLHSSDSDSDFGIKKPKGRGRLKTADDETKPKQKRGPKKKTEKIKDLKAKESHSSDSDSDFGLKKSKSNEPEMNQDALFDSLLKSSNKNTVVLDTESQDDSPIKPPQPAKAAPAKATKPRKPAGEKTTKPKKPAGKRPKKAMSGSDSDDMFSSPVKKKKSRKGASDDDDNDDDEDMDLDDFGSKEAPPPPRSTSGRAKKPVKYDFGDDSDE